MKVSKFKLAMLILLMCLAVGVGLLVLTQKEEPAKPEFNVFNLEAGGNLVKFNLQNLGEADAHNVSIKVNGTWCPQIEVEITSVEEGYVVTPEQIATVFRGTIRGPTEYIIRVLKTGVPSIAGTERDVDHETQESTFLKVMVMENETYRYLTDSEVTAIKEVLENPHPYYTSTEETIDILRKDEIKTVEIHLEWGCDSFEMVISCDEGVALEETM